MRTQRRRTQARSRKQRRRAAGAVLVAALATLAGAWWLRARSPLPARFSVVAPNVLYRSGAPSPEQLVQLVERYRLRTVMDLRGPGEPGVEAERDLAARLGLAWISLPISSTEPPDAETLATLRRAYTDPARRPILVHCEHGIARTGVAIAIWRIENETRSGEHAVEEMIDKGYPVRRKNGSMRRRLAHWAKEDALGPGGR